MRHSEKRAIYVMEAYTCAGYRCNISHHQSKASAVKAARELKTGGFAHSYRVCFRYMNGTGDRLVTKG